MLHVMFTRVAVQRTHKIFGLKQLEVGWARTPPNSALTGQLGAEPYLKGSSDALKSSKKQRLSLEISDVPPTGEETISTTAAPQKETHRQLRQEPQQQQEFPNI